MPALICGKVYCAIYFGICSQQKSSALSCTLFISSRIHTIVVLIVWRWCIASQHVVVQYEVFSRNKYGSIYIKLWRRNMIPHTKVCWSNMLTGLARNINRIYLVTGNKWLVLLNADSIKERKFLLQLNDCQPLERTMFHWMRKWDRESIKLSGPTVGSSGQCSVFIGESGRYFVTQLLKSRSRRVERKWRYLGLSVKVIPSNRMALKRVEHSVGGDK
jgi:hypothetical protein